MKLRTYLIYNYLITRKSTRTENIYKQKYKKDDSTFEASKFMHVTTNALNVT